MFWAEIEIYNGHNTVDGHLIEFAVIPIQVLCGTQLMYEANALQRQLRAEHVTFSQAIDRDEYGMPAYPREEKKKR